MRRFEFNAYAATGENGEVSSSAVVTVLEFDEKRQATAHAGRLAKQIKGPVDIAFGDTRAWQERYITTAMPSDHNASGYRLERLG